MQSAVNSQPTTKQPKPPPLARIEGGWGKNAEEWKLAMERTCKRKRIPPKPEMPLQNSFSALQTDERRPFISGQTLELRKAALSAPRITTAKIKKRERVVGDFLLRGMEAFAELMCYLERHFAYQRFVSGMSTKDYQALYCSLTVICCCVSHGQQ